MKTITIRSVSVSSMYGVEQAAAEDINISPARVITSSGEAEARVWTPGTIA